VIIVLVLFYLFLYLETRSRRQGKIMEKSQSIVTLSMANMAEHGLYHHSKVASGRGSRSNLTGRYEPHSRILYDDGWDSLSGSERLKTEVTQEIAKKIITTNQSPDISFDRSINAYRGCEHGCSYCYARPTHTYMGLSPGRDFETRLFAKVNAAELLETEFANAKYRPRTIAMGTNTDPYQPIERERRLTRAILQVMLKYRHPVAIITKSALITRDIDVLKPLAELGLVKCAISLTTLDKGLARSMEPRASAPHRRLQAMEELNQAGIPCVTMTAPIIPGLNDSEIEILLGAAANAGAKEAGYVMLRLPLEVRDLFKDWLQTHVPDRAEKVMSLVASTREGKDYDATWGKRMRGTGPYAWSIGRRFEMAAKRLELNRSSLKLRTDIFIRPQENNDQLNLFDAA
jgi:DNA repair photolyase